MESIIGHRKDYNGVGALRYQRHIPGKNLAKYPPGHRYIYMGVDTPIRGWGGMAVDSGGTPFDGLYREAPLESGIFFRRQVYERVGISLVEVYKG